MIRHGGITLGLALVFCSSSVTQQRPAELSGEFGSWAGSGGIFQQIGVFCGERYCHGFYSLFLESKNEEIVAHMTLNLEQPRRYIQVLNSDEFYELDRSKLAADTSLKTDTGKRITLLDYLPPTNHSPATFIFSRNLPDGTSFISPVDKELRFETRLNKRKITIKIDLRKPLPKRVKRFGNIPLDPEKSPI